MSINDIREGIKRVEPEEAERLRIKRNEALAEREEEVQDLADELEKRQDLVFLGEKTELSRKRGGVELAHQLFLYGLPKGPRRNVPIRKPSRLSTLAGVSVRDLAPHLDVWRKEAMRIAREASPLHSFAVSEKAKSLHQSDIEAMRVEISRMEEALEELTPGSPPYEKMMKLLILARKEWQDSSGVGAGVRVSEKALELEAQALAEALKEDRGSGPVQVDAEVFDVD